MVCVVTLPCKTEMVLNQVLVSCLLSAFAVFVLPDIRDSVVGCSNSVRGFETKGVLSKASPSLACNGFHDNASTSSMHLDLYGEYKNHDRSRIKMRQMMTTSRSDCM